MSLITPGQKYNNTKSHQNSVLAQESKILTSTQTQGTGIRLILKEIKRNRNTLATGAG